MSYTSTRPVIFISYARADEPERPADGEVQWLSFVLRFLRPAVIGGIFDTWDDRRIAGGADWSPEIETQLRNCDIFILLVSASSMASDYIVDKEIAIIRERRAKGEPVHFYPLLLTPTPKAGLDKVRDKNLRPSYEKPFSAYAAHDRAQHMTDAANEIAEIAEAIVRLKSGTEAAAARRTALPGPAHTRLPNMQLLVIPQGRTDTASSIEFSPDGRCTLTRSKDDTARLWDADVEPPTSPEGGASAATIRDDAQPPGACTEAAPSPVRIRFGMSTMLLLTVLVVMLAEVCISMPSIAQFRLQWLENKLAAAYTAALVFEVKPEVPESLSRQILDSIGARTLVVKSGQQRRLLATTELPSKVLRDVDTRDTGPLLSIVGALRTLLVAEDGDLLRVVGQAPMDGQFMEIVILEGPLRKAMWTYSQNILMVSIVISAISATLVYLLLLYTIPPVRVGN
jgi:hypothetical protein